VVILQYNLSDMTEICLQSVLENDYENIKEIIIVDNGSSDPFHANRFKNRYDNVRVIEQSPNVGYCGGTNVGWKAATGDHILLLNNDTALSHNCISMLVKTMETDDKIGWAGACYQAGPWTNCRVWFPPEAIEELDQSKGSVRGKMNEYANSLPDDPKINYWDATEVTALLMRKTMSDQIGYFWDELFEHHQADYVLRMEVENWKVAVCGNAIFWHSVGSPTLQSMGIHSQARRQCSLESTAMMSKRYPNVDLSRLFPW